MVGTPPIFSSATLLPGKLLELEVDDQETSPVKNPIILIIPS